MIPLQIADLLLSGVSQAAPTAAGAPGGTIEFLSVFERAIGVDAATPTTEGAVAADTIDINGIATSLERPVMPQSSSGDTVEKRPGGRIIDSAVTMLMAAFALSTQSAVAEPLPDPALISDFSPQVIADGSVVAPSPAACALPDGVPVANLLAEATAHPVIDPGAMTREAGATAVIPEPTLPSQEKRNMALPTDVETHVAVVDRAMDVDAHADMSLLSDAPLPATSGDAAHLSVAGDTITSVAAPIRHDDGTEKIITDNSRMVGQPEEPSRNAQEAVTIEKTDARAPARPIEGTDVAPRPVVGSHVDAPAADPTVAGSVRVGTLRQPDQAVVTTAAFQPSALNGEAEAYPAADTPQNNAELTVISEPVDRRSSVVFPSMTAWTEPSRAVRQPLGVARESGGTREATAEAETPAVASVDGTRSGMNIGGGDPGRAVVMAADQQARGDLGSPTVAKPDGLPPLSAVAEESARVAVALSGEGAGRQAARSAPASNQSNPPESERFSDDVSGRLWTIHADGDRTAGRQGSPRSETVLDARQDRSASGSDSGSPSLDRSSSPSGNEQSFGADLTYAAAPKGEALRSGGAAASTYPRTLVDQVADQIATTARISPRADGERVRLRLHPETLGELVIEVSWKDSGIVAAIKTQSHVAGELLTSDLGRLRTALGEQGIPISGLGVQVELDFRQWNYAGAGTHALPFVRRAPEAQSWRDRESASSAAHATEPESLIDIRV